jgi:hypothetical protein
MQMDEPALPSSLSPALPSCERWARGCPGWLILRIAHARHNRTPSGRFRASIVILYGVLALREQAPRGD